MKLFSHYLMPNTEARAKVREEQLQFLRQSARLEESATPYVVRGAMTTLSVLIFAFIGWAAIVEIEEIAQTQGEVVPSGFTQIVQHYDGGFVKEILVREGTKVFAGDVLLRLDGAGAQQDLNKARIEFEGLQRAAETADEMFTMQETLKKQGVALHVKYLETRRARDIAKSELNQQKEVIERLKDRVARLEVRAPVTGLVKGLKLNTIGEVVKPAEALMEIVPTAQTLVVETHISPSDVGHVSVGQPVKVKVSSYDSGRFGTVEGTLDFMTATTFENAKGGKYYRGRVNLKQAHVGTHSQMKLMPGMTVQAGIITGKKTILAYLLKPVQRALADSLSEK
jgi:multidrug efflux pump subunit AcrA (membrane-fusion protein)